MNFSSLLESNIWLSIVTALGILQLTLAIIATIHILRTKLVVSSAIGWIAVVWLSPYLGLILYLVLGINRIQRRALLCRKGEKPNTLCAAREVMPPKLFEKYSTFSNSVIDSPATTGNKISPFLTGQEAYEAMWQAIDAAKEFIFLETYIFDNDRAGKIFVEKLAGAKDRGVQVRVLVDSAGTRYSHPRIQTRLKEFGVPHALFGNKSFFGSLAYANMRNHRKLMVVDGKKAFCGGMNIRESYLSWSKSEVGTLDVHFQYEGPVVKELQKVFLEDWWYETSEDLSSSLIVTGDKEKDLPGEGLVRVVTDGPDQAFGKTRRLFLFAIGAAQETIRIVTPYFVPDQHLIEALKIAALSGIKVQIILPEANNLKLVKWASTHVFEPLLEAGCEIWYTKPPFDHTKLAMIGEHWVYAGSSNWDQRSFRLNFEVNTEIIDPRVAATMKSLIDNKIANARLVTLDEIRTTPVTVKLRDSMAHLAQPYL